MTSDYRMEKRRFVPTELTCCGTAHGASESAYFGVFFLFPSVCCLGYNLSLMLGVGGCGLDIYSRLLNRPID
jgi:hypothetical protein